MTSYVAEDIASEMHHMNIGAKMLVEIQRNFKDDPVSQCFRTNAFFVNE